MEINPLIELVPIIRSYSEDGWSNPKKILDRIISNLKEEETGLFTYESLLNRIMDYLYDEKILTTSKVQAHVLWRILEEGCENVLGKYLSDNVDNLVEDCNKLTEYLNQELLENPQVTAKRRYTEHELRKLLPGYSKGKYHADILIKNLSRALYNAEKFCQNGELLVSEIGTNIGKLIKLLRGEKERERFK